jgi:hypothetical protein
MNLLRTRGRRRAAGTAAARLRHEGFSAQAAEDEQHQECKY